MKVGEKVYYIVDGHLYDGLIMEVEEKGHQRLFCIDSYGTCEGHYQVDEGQVNKWVFFDYEKAQAAIHSLKQK